MEATTTPGIGMGIYTYAEASRLLDMPVDMLRRWDKGYERWHGDAKRAIEGVIDSPENPYGIISFLRLIELRSVKRFRDAGVRLQNIRQVHTKLRSELGTPYPFATDRFATDGQAIIDKEKMLDVAKQQKVFAFVREMFKQLDVSEDGLAERWHPLGKDHLIVLDPARSFGAPIEQRSGIRTEILYRAFIAEGENAEAVASWYEVSEEGVLEAVSYEVGLLAA